MIQFPRFTDITVSQLIGKLIEIVNEVIIIRIQQITFLQLTDCFSIHRLKQFQSLFLNVVSDIRIKPVRSNPLSLSYRSKRNPTVFQA